MDASKADLVHWVRRYDVAERRAAAERGARPWLSPDESLERALELAALAEETGRHPSAGGVPEEDLAVYAVWSRLRRALRGARA
ncbi:MAG: hypothetical protein HY744_24870 [Deltaproteobacteria bacterium]|nr:hypothetical protein [Deltaproteobacteria bacterium]